MIVGTLEAALEECDPQPIEVNFANGSLRPPLITMLACGTRTSPVLMGRIRPLFWPCSAELREIRSASRSEESSMLAERIDTEVALHEAL
jgi:hypothetical protein